MAEKESVEKIKTIQRLLAKANDGLLGCCIFCEKPIIVTQEHIEKAIFDFFLLVQRVFFHMDGKHTQQEIQAFLCCRECTLSQYKLKIMKQMAEIHFDLTKVNEQFAKALAESLIKEKVQKDMADQLKALETPVNAEVKADA